MWLGTSSSSSSLSPLPSSHLHRIHKLYEYPEYDLPIASSSKIASTPSGPSSSGNAVTEDGSSVEEGLQSLSIRHGREESSKSASPALMQRKVTPEQAKAFYPVSYVRGEWMQKLLALDLGKRKIRYWLSDEVLCLGSPLAPITSEVSSGLSFYEAYKHNTAPESASVYMSDEQVIWLVDELYSSLGAKNSKLTYADVDIDTKHRVQLREFKAIRRVSFRNNVAGFRRRCGLQMITKAMMAENMPVAADKNSGLKQNWKQAPKIAASELPASITAAVTGTQAAAKDVAAKEATNSVLTPHSNSDLSTKATTPEGRQSSTPTTILLQSEASPPPKAFVSLTRAERQARLQAQREEVLRKHLAQQRAALPAHRRFYRNLEKYGGAALACDVESWTEDAEVLLELGMAWFVWRPSESRVEVTERDGGSCHYIIEETIQYRNEEIEATRWDYSLGMSETLPQKQVSNKLREKISELSKFGPLVLVFHDASAETRYFQKLGVDSDIFNTIIPADSLSSTPLNWPSKATPSSIIIQDTQNLYAGWSEPQIKQINLGKACLTFGLEDEAMKLHNAGNDAFATLRLWEILLEMDEYEKQKPVEPASRRAAVPQPAAVAEEKKGLPEENGVVKQAAAELAAEVHPTAAGFPDLIQLW